MATKSKLACSWGGRGQLRWCLIEVNRVRSTASPHTTDDGKGRSSLRLSDDQPEQGGAICALRRSNATAARTSNRHRRLRRRVDEREGTSAGKSIGTSEHETTALTPTGLPWTSFLTG